MSNLEATGLKDLFGEILSRPEVRSEIIEIAWRARRRAGHPPSYSLPVGREADAARLPHWRLGICYCRRSEGTKGRNGKGGRNVILC